MRPRQIEGALINGDKQLEALALFAPIVEIARRDRAAVEAAFIFAPFPDHHQPLLIRKIERAKNQCVREAEDRRVRRDSRCNRDDGDKSEAGLLHQRSRAVTQILPQVLQPPRLAGVAALLLHLLRTAESEPSPSSRFLRIEALRDEISRVLVEMEAQLFFEFLFHLLSEPQSSPPGHLAPPSDILRIRPTASVSGIRYVHSHRRAIIGSTFIARRAGM